MNHDVLQAQQITTRFSPIYLTPLKPEGWNFGSSSFKPTTLLEIAQERSPPLDTPLSSGGNLACVAKWTSARKNLFGEKGREQWVVAAFHALD